MQLFLISPVLICNVGTLIFTTKRNWMLLWKTSVLKMNMLHAQANDWKVTLQSTRAVIHGAGAIHGRPECYILLGK